MNPLWVDARDYLTSQGEQITTHGLNAAMNLLASNPQLRPSAVKAGGGAAGIAAGLGAPTDQIVSTPLAPPASQGIKETPLPPPVSRPPSGGGKQGASSGKRTAGGTSASGKTVKDVPAGVGNYAAAGSQDNANRYGVTPPAPTPMGGYTPGASPSAPSSPVGMAQAGTGAEDPGFIAHLMGGDYNGRLAALGGAGASILAALLMGRGGGGGGMRPRGEAPVPPGTAVDTAGLSGEVLPPDRLSGPTPNLPTTYGRPVLNDPIQQLLGQSAPEAPPRQTYYGDGAGNVIGDNSPVSSTPGPVGGTFGDPLGPGAREGRGYVGAPQSFEDMIAQLAAQAPRGGALPPPAARPPIQMPNQTSGPPIAIPPTGGQQLMDLLSGLGRQ